MEHYQTEHDQIFTSILSLLNNAKDLLFHSDRQNAERVIKAVNIYAQENGILFNEDKFKVFSRVLLDSRQNTLNNIIDDIALDFIATEKKSKKSKSKK